MTFLYLSTDGGYKVKPDIKMGDVRTPNYVYDLWLPLLGVECIGVYSVYRRIQRNGVIRGLSMEQLASACRIGKTTLSNIHKKLIACDLISIKRPDSLGRVKHYTCEITVNEAPTEIKPELIKTYGHPAGYEPLTLWLVDPSDNGTNDPHRTVSVPNQVVETTQSGPRVDPIGTAVIESSMFETPIVETSRVEGGIAGVRETNTPPEKPVAYETKETGRPANYKAKVVDPNADEPVIRIAAKPRAVQENASKSPPIPRSGAPLPAPDDELTLQAMAHLVYGNSRMAVPKDTRGKLLSALMNLTEIEPSVNAERIKAFGVYWNQADWRGKKGSRPTASQVASEWPMFTDWEQSSPTGFAAYEHLWDNDDAIQVDEDYIEEQAPVRTPIHDGALKVWEATCDQLEVQLNRATVSSRIRVLRLTEFSESADTWHYTFVTRYQHEKDWIMKHLIEALYQDFAKIGKAIFKAQKAVDIKILVEGENAAQTVQSLSVPETRAEQ